MKTHNSTSAEDPHRLLHELQVHQIELEMQNAELEESRNGMESLLEKFSDLYDFSPVGYFTLTPAGTIQQVNLTGARLVRLERSRLTGQPFALLVSPPHRPAFHAFLKQVFSVQTKQSCELSLVRAGQPSRIVNIEAQCSSSRQDCSAVVMDITDRKRIEEAQRGIEVLAASNRKLEQEIVRRQVVEESLKKSEREQRQLLEQSRRMQEQLRLLSRGILSSQEEDRKRISRELHDVIAQMLTTINLRLATLKMETSANTRGLGIKISRTQRLVEKSVDLVHRFARELRPAVLDDLGLVPALHSFMKDFTQKTGIRVTLTAFGGVEQLPSATRTVLYRVAHEALSNVARHAKTDRADVSIQKRANAICMEISDKGHGFDPKKILMVGTCKRLGILGTRERVEMVGGTFTIQSAPGKGTTLRAEIPFGGLK